MESFQGLVKVEEEDLLDEMPKEQIANEKTQLSEANKDDSGLEISDSMEALKENVENHFLDELGCETRDATEVNIMPLSEFVSLPSNDSQITSPNDKKCSSKNTSGNESQEENLLELKSFPETNHEQQENTSSESSVNFETQNASRRSSTSSFIDSLLDKLRRNNSDSSGSEFSPKKPRKEEKRKCSDDELLVEITSPITYMKSSNPNMLPTPIVENQSISSVFVNSVKEYEEAVQRNKQKFTFRQDDKAKMTNKSLPPRMTAPKLPSNMQHPRTLAQKRLLLSNNLNFLIIEQESKIYKQIQRKNSDKELNYKLIKSFSGDDIPIKHGPWKALSWLRTEEGNYIQQYINIDGQNYKLSGSKGNHENKFLQSQSSKPFPKNQKTSLRSVRCCEGGKVKKRILDGLASIESIKRFILEESLNPFKKLEISLYSQLSSIKPRPLSKKIEHLNKNRKLLDKDEDSVFLGDYIKFKMPDIKLEVQPQIKVPLDPKAKQYLNEIIPYRDMNENWINFSLSTLSTKDEVVDTKNSFEFTIPYVDGKQHILARKIVKTSNQTDILVKTATMSATKVFEKEIKWTFDKNCDKNDTLEMEIVDILKDLTNSVCLNLNDDLFTLNDPIDRNPTTIAPIKAKEAIENMASTSKNTKTDHSKKMLLELRRLNANVVKSDASHVDDDENTRRHALAHLAKDERELRPTVIVTDSDTVLLSNKSTETRRQKRAPKRYSDYMHSETGDKEVDFEPPKKSTPKELIDQPFKTRAQCNDVGMTHEEIKKLKEEVRNWIHVNVDVRKLEHLENLQPFCMVHNLYKCSCRRHTSHEKYKVFSDTEIKVADITGIKNLQVKSKVDIDSSNVSIISENSPVKEESISEELMDFEEASNVETENSRRVLPIDLEKPRKSICEVDLEDENKENAPKMEILNISELVNGGIGPVYINIYDTKVNRLNPIFRSILNNKSALVYVDGLGYYLDMKKIDVMKLKFDNIRQELDHPIFIIRPKICHAPEEAKICGDFVNLLFKEDSEILLQIKDKMILKEVAKIIEIILQSVRRKIEAQIGCEPNDFVKDQLSLITRDRSNSNSSVSSADTSPLTFNGKILECAPSPGLDTDMMKEFNQIFSMRMQRLCAIIRSNTIGLHLLDGYVNKFYIYKWNLLLQSFEEDLISIWRVKLANESNNYFNYVITNTPKPPTVENADAESIVNVKNLSLNSTAVLIRMMLLKVENSATKNMTVLLYGCRGYFRICGVLNNKENYFDHVLAKPTQHTHPRLTAKIQKVYNIWYGLKQAKAAENRLKCQLEAENTLQKQQQKENGCKINVDEKENESKMDVDEEENKNQEVEEPENETKSSIIPKQPSKYKWFLFHIDDDFSHIFIKQWKNYLPYNTIINAINRAKKLNRTVRILGPINSAKDFPKIFALSKAPLNFKKGEKLNTGGNFLLFGPYLRDSNSNLLLMQNVNGKMLLRDDFEAENNISRTSRTRCLWIYANSLKCVTDTQIDSIQPLWGGKRQLESSNKNSTESDPLSLSDEQSQPMKKSSIVGGIKKVF